MKYRGARIFLEALRWLRRMLRDQTAGAAPVPQEATAYLNIARCYLFRGDLEACERHLEQAMERCQLFNLIAMSGEVLEAYGNLYRKRNDAPRATEFYERAARLYDDAGLDVTRCEVQEEHALLDLYLGQIEAARARLDRLVEARAAAGDELGTETAKLARGRVLLAQHKFDAATAELELARDYFDAHELFYYEAQACLALAACYKAAGKDAELFAPLRRALALVARYDYSYWLSRELPRHPALWHDPVIVALLPEALRALAPPPDEVAGAESSYVAAHIDAHAAPPKPDADLTIRMLGPVEILRDPARPLPADAWTTKRARDILCFIASRRHRRASKDTIIETFWGDADFDVVEKNFHPTVSHIRKALNSKQPIKQNFLLYRDGDYLLSQEFSYFIDAEEFDARVAEGEAARRAGQTERYVELYEAAIDLYGGDFMQGSTETWAEEQRAYYREQYLRILEVLAVAAQKAADWPRVLRLAQQILTSDPYREDVHCMIMRAQAATGNRNAVNEQYEALRRLLRRELGVDPSPASRQLLRQLVS